MSILMKKFNPLISFFTPAGGKCPGCGWQGGWTLDSTGPNGEKY